LSTLEGSGAMGTAFIESPFAVMYTRRCFERSETMNLL
jgi:hypothetical protein